MATLDSNPVLPGFNGTLWPYYAMLPFVRLEGFEPTVLKLWASCFTTKLQALLSARWESNPLFSRLKVWCNATFCYERYLLAQLDSNQCFQPLPKCSVSDCPVIRHWAGTGSWTPFSRLQVWCISPQCFTCLVALEVRFELTILGLTTHRLCHLSFSSK